MASINFKRRPKDLIDTLWVYHQTYNSDLGVVGTGGAFHIVQVHAVQKGHALMVAWNPRSEIVQHRLLVPIGELLAQFSCFVLLGYVKELKWLVVGGWIAPSRRSFRSFLFDMQGAWQIDYFSGVGIHLVSRRDRSAHLGVIEAAHFFRPASRREIELGRSLQGPVGSAPPQDPGETENLEEVRVAQADPPEEPQKDTKPGPSAWERLVDEDE